MLNPGQILDGRYEVVATIQSGGMGALYSGKDSRLAGSPCAIKAMLPQSDQFDEYVRGRFLEEMRVLSSLNHPGIPRVRDHFVEGQTVYIIMDLIDGRNLGQVLQSRLQETGRPMSGPEVVDIGLQVLDVLEYLHGHNPPIVHRDIKPANLIEEVGGRIKLVDFGLAAPETADTRSQVGTIGYCPLEQMRGRVVAQSDIYALGATLHHLLTGRPPAPLTFEPLARLRPDLPLLLIEAINTAIARTPEDRHQDVAAFRLALQQGLGSKAKVQVQSSDEATMLYSKALGPPSGATAPVVPTGRSGLAPTREIVVNPMPAGAPGATSLLPWLLAAASMVCMAFVGLWAVGTHSSTTAALPSPTTAPLAEPSAAEPTPPPRPPARPQASQPPVSLPPPSTPRRPQPVNSPQVIPVAQKRPEPVVVYTPRLDSEAPRVPTARPATPRPAVVAAPPPVAPAATPEPRVAQPEPRMPEFPPQEPPPFEPPPPMPGGPPHGPPPTSRPDPYLNPR